MRYFLLSEESESELKKPKLQLECSLINVNIEGIHLEALVDTGSKLTCISAEFFDKFSSKLKHLPILPVVGVQVIGFVGEKSLLIKKTNTCTFRIE